MILDALLQFSSNQALANAVGSYDSTNTLDLGVNGLPTSAMGGGARDIGVGDSPALKMFVAVAQAFASGGAATLQAQLQGAPDNGSGAPGTFYTLAYGPVVPVTLLATPGVRIMKMDMPRVPTGNPQPRFLKMTYVIAGAAMTAGAINADIVLEDGEKPAGQTGLASGYPAGININN